MQSKKEQKPTLSGQRIKTRKRDIKEQYDPAAFRDFILEGFEEAGDNVDAIYKFLDTAGGKVDYHRYGEILMDLLFSGGILAPGGAIQLDDEGKRSPFCIMLAKDDGDDLKKHIDIIHKLLRRYKYLQKRLSEEIAKILKFIKGFEKSELSRLANAVTLFFVAGTVSANVLTSLLNEHVVKEGLALNFVTLVFKRWLQEASIEQIAVAMRKGEMEGRLLEFLAPNIRDTATFEKHFLEQNMEPLVKYHNQKQTAVFKNQLGASIKEMIQNDAPVSEIASFSLEHIKKHELTKSETVGIVWDSLMSGVDWSKKPDQLAEQAMRHVKAYAKLLEAFSGTVTAEVTLIVKIQIFCYENMNFMKLFQRIVLVLYNSDVLGEDAIMKWYETAHSPKGKTAFLNQMQKMIDWLRKAEEESTDDEQQQ
eukprot:Colp12_sorted_trinity150504_noHs@31192